MQSFSKFLSVSATCYHDACAYVEQNWGDRNVLGEEKFLELVKDAQNNMSSVGDRTRESHQLKNETPNEERKFTSNEGTNNGVQHISERISAV